MTTIEIDDDLKARILRLADARHESPDRMMRDAIAEYADRAEAHQSFMEEADASWQAYREDGLHLTGSEVRAWLASCRTEGDVAMPECHK